MIGYYFKIISRLEGIESISCVYSTLAERLDLLATVLVSNDDDWDIAGDADTLQMDVDDDADDEDDIRGTLRPPQRKSLFIQRSSNMSSLSGADQMAYMEVDRSARTFASRK